MSSQSPQDVTLPGTIRAALAAIDDGDNDAFVAAFAGSGTVNDNGRAFNGHHAIRLWSQTEFIGLGGKLRIRQVHPTHDGASVEADVSSVGGFNGYSRFDFVATNDGLVRMTISA